MAHINRPPPLECEDNAGDASQGVARDEDHADEAKGEAGTMDKEGEYDEAELVNDVNETTPRFPWFTLTLIVLVLGVVVALEIYGSEHDYPLLRLSHWLEMVGTWVDKVQQKVGYWSARISDILGWIRSLLDRLWEWLEPIWKKVSKAIGSIMYQFFSVIKQPIISFIQGYSDGLRDVYDRTATILVTAMWSFLGGILLVIVAEMVGTVRKIPRLRPSYHLKAWAARVYRKFYWLTYWSLLLFNFFGHVMELLKQFNVNIKPYLEKMDVSVHQIKTAFHSLVDAPLAGMWRGGQLAMNRIFHQLRSSTVFAYFPILVCVCGAIVGVCFVPYVVKGWIRG